MRSSTVALIAAAFAILVVASSAAMSAPTAAQRGTQLDALASNATANSSAGFQDVVILSTYAGQDQALGLPLNASGFLVYPQWSITLISQTSANYSIYLDGANVASGVVFGGLTLYFNLTGRDATILIGIGAIVYHYSNEVVSQEALGSYYASAPAPLVATAGQVLGDALLVLGVLLINFIGAMFVSRRIVIARANVDTVEV